MFSEHCASSDVHCSGEHKATAIIVTPDHLANFMNQAFSGYPGYLVPSWNSLKTDFWRLSLTDNCSLLLNLELISSFKFLVFLSKDSIEKVIFLLLFTDTQWVLPTDKLPLILSDHLP